jgi:hypothetical protein
MFFSSVGHTLAPLYRSSTTTIASLPVVVPVLDLQWILNFGFSKPNLSPSVFHFHLRVAPSCSLPSQTPCCLPLRCHQTPALAPARRSHAPPRRRFPPPLFLLWGVLLLLLFLYFYVMLFCLVFVGFSLLLWFWSCCGDFGYWRSVLLFVMQSYSFQILSMLILHRLPLGCHFN